MAGINGFRQLFNGAQLQNVVNQFHEEIHQDILEVYRYIGEEFVNKARTSGNYSDRTGNLRSSIGYIILFNGKIVEQNFEGNTEGKNQGINAANELAEQHPEGYVIIGVAGMKYSAYVEARNYDVITGSAPETEMLKSILSEI